MALFSFMKPEAAQALPQWKAFEHLFPRKAPVAQPKPGTDQFQLRRAEQSRWESGYEMLPPDFAELVAVIDEKLAHWTA